MQARIEELERRPMRVHVLVAADPWHEPYIALFPPGGHMPAQCLDAPGLRADLAALNAAARRLYQVVLDATVPAEALMTTDLPAVSLGTPVGDLLPLLAEGTVDAVPVLRAEMIVGIVTRTDLVAALARRLALEEG